jgi:SSU ribosomal protein S17E
MGRVKNKKVKRIARALLEKFPNLFTTDFEHNKLKIKEMQQELNLSKKERNQIAGYIVRLVKQQTKKKEEEQ